MRHEVTLESKLRTIAGRLRWSMVWGLIFAATGCQLTRPPVVPASAVHGPMGTQATMASGPGASSEDAAPPMSASTKIRGQSGSGTWNGSSWDGTTNANGSGDNSNGVASDSTQPNNPTSPSNSTIPSNTKPPASSTNNSLNQVAAGSSDLFRKPMPATETAPSDDRYQPVGYLQTLPPPEDAGTIVLQPPYYPQDPPGTYPPGTFPPGQASGAPGAGVLPPPTGYGAPPPGYGNVPPPPGYGPPGQPYTAPGYGYAAPGGYGATIAPGAIQSLDGGNATLAPGAFPTLDPRADPMAGYQPRERIAPLDVYLQEGRTGRIMLGGSVNSDLGVAGQLIIEERNFDFRRLPTSWNDLWGGKAFRGDGQNFRLELMPGNLVERYTANWSTNNLGGYLPYSLSVGGFYFTRQFRDWTEQRIGGRLALGYAIRNDLSISGEMRLEDVNLFDARVSGVEELDRSLGSNDLYTARLRIAHDTRDSPFMSTEGGLFEFVYDQVFGEYDYPRAQVNLSRYFLVRERPGGGGRHTLAATFRVGVSGSQTPIFENYFAGGYSSLRGFSFRGASPVVGGVQVGGELMMLGSLEYVFPLTADEMLRGVAFVDYGTVEQEIDINAENFRVAPGLGLRVTVPALGPAPLAFDFAVPINYSETDDRQVFSFFMGFTR